MREVDLTSGTISTVASGLFYDTGVALDAVGNLFIADSDDTCIWELDSGTDSMTLIAGGISDYGYDGDGGPAVNALFNWPAGIAIDSSGDIIVADATNNVVREIGSVAAVNTTVYLTASASSTVYDDEDGVTFTATVSPPYLGGNLLSLGDDTVEFRDGETSLGSETIDSTGHATLATSDLSLGPHTITAEFTGDSYHAPSSSGSVTETIVHDSSTSLSLSTSSAAEGSPVTLTATVDGEGEGTPTGVVAFLDGTTVLGYSPLREVGDSIIAAFTTAYLAAGDHTDITAVYQGDSNFISSTSSAVSYDALPIVTPTLTSSTSEIVSGTSQTVTLTASVPSTASGTVTFMDGGTSLGSPQTLNNTATETDALLLDSADGGINTDLTASYPEMTIRAWVRIDGWTDNGEIVDCFDGSGGGFWPGVGYSPGGDWYVQTGDGSWDTGIPAQLANPALGNGGWNHISVVFTSSNIFFYYNDMPAVSLGSAGDWGAFGGSSSGLTIGYDGTDGYPLNVDAAIQEVDVWSTDLTPTEESQLYNNGVVLTSGYPESGSLEGVYHLNDSPDGSYGAPDGTLFGTYSWTTATPDLSVATLTVNTDDTSPYLSAGSNSVTAAYNGESDVFGSGTSAVLPITVVSTTLPSSSPDETTAVDDVPSQATPSPLTDGSMVLSLDDAGLTYVSGSNGQPIVSIDSTIPSGGSGTLEGVTATLYMGDTDTGTPVGESYYTATDLTGDDGTTDATYRFAVKYTGTPLDTGHYEFTVAIAPSYSGSSPSPSTTTVPQNVLNWNSSPFGAGWMLDGLDQLVTSDSGALLVQSDGTMAYFSGDSYTSPAGPFAFSSLTYSDSYYQLVGTDGTKETFNSSGQLVSVTDNDGNITSYTYSSDRLYQITNPSHQTTTFSYNDSDLVATIEDFVERDTTLTYNGYGQLIQVTDPNPEEGETQPVSEFTYESDTAPLVSYTDANGNATLYAYRPDGTLQTVTSADGSTVTYQAAQALLFGSGDTPGSSDNPAYLVPSTTVRAVATDESEAPTLYTFDTFGDPTSVEDALGNTTIYVYDDNGLATEMIQPAVVNGTESQNPVTEYTYYSDTNEMDTEQVPDGSTQTWTYATYTTAGGPDDVVTSYQKVVSDTGSGDYTAYTYYTSTGDLVETEEYANGETDYGESATADYEGQNTVADGADPITTYVYTQYSDSDSAPPAGLVLSTTNPDGDVTAYAYNAAGDETASYQGQTISNEYDDPSYSSYDEFSTWTFSNLALNASGTFEIYASSSIGSNYKSAYQTVGSGSPGSVSIVGTGGGAPASTLGSGWVDLGQVTLSAGATTLAVKLTGIDTMPSQICIMEQTSGTVYNSADDPVSQTDAMNNVTTTTYDDLDRPVASSHGQTLIASSNEATFENLPQSPGQSRTYVLYGYVSSGMLEDDFSFADTENESFSTSPFAYAGSDSTPLGSGWYDLGTVTLTPLISARATNCCRATGGFCLSR